MKKSQNLSDLASFFTLLAHLWDYPQEDLILKGIQIFQLIGFGIAPEAIAINSELEAEYIRLFVNNPQGLRAAPYASVQLTGLLAQEPSREAAEFYYQAGLTHETIETADYLPIELAFVAYLLKSNQKALLQDFLRKHLWRWFPLFKKALEAAEPHPFYRLLVEVTEKALYSLMEEVLL